MARVLAIDSTQAVLVGGQALAFLTDHLELPLPPDLDSGVTADIDFLGTAALAREHGKRLGWKTWVPSLDDATPRTGELKAVPIDAFRTTPALQATRWPQIVREVEQARTAAAT